MSTLTKNLVAASDTIAKCLMDQSFILASEGFGRLLFETVTSNHNIFICGNGGSYCDAAHFAEELTGRFRKDRRSIGAIVLGEAAHSTCVGNDYGFEFIFSRQIEGLAREGDLLIGISTSGNSKNIIEAVKSAKTVGMATAALLGKDGGLLASMVSAPIIVPSNVTERIQEIHIKLIHSAIEELEARLFPELYQPC